MGRKQKKLTIEEYQEEVDHDVDLSVFLQGKHLPVVYGVMRTPGIPVFADTLKNDPNSIYVAYAISEGEIQGIYNLYIDGNSLLCVDAQDSTARSGSNAENTALTCFGRMDRGGTLGGTNINSSGTLLASIDSVSVKDIISLPGPDKYSSKVIP